MDDVIYLDSESTLPCVGEGVLVGYAVLDGNIIFQTAGLRNYQASGKSFSPQEGKFISILPYYDRVEICTDYSGQELLFYYAKDGFWAISNSFSVLIANLASKVKLQPYKPGFSSFFLKNGFHLGEQQVSHRTAVEDVLLLPTSKKIVISRTGCLTLNKRYEYEDLFIDDYENGVLDFIETMSGIFASLMDSGSTVFSQLSGGYDSRVVLSLLLQSPVCQPESIHRLSELSSISEPEVQEPVSCRNRQPSCPIIRSRRIPSWRNAHVVSSRPNTSCASSQKPMPASMVSSGSCYAAKSSTTAS